MMRAKILEWLGFPGLIKPFEYEDWEQSLKVSLETSPRYTILSINGRRLYFLRESGRFDGTGEMSLDDATSVNRLLAERIQRSKSPHDASSPTRPV